MTRLSGDSDTHFKFELTEDEKERFRWACHHFSQKHQERWSMGKTLRSLMLNFTDDMLKDAAGETSAEDVTGDTMAG